MKPIFNESRLVAYAFQPALDAELDRMQKECIIDPTDNSEWVTPLIIVLRAMVRLEFVEILRSR